LLGGVTKLRKIIYWLKDDEVGQGMVEYVLIIVLIAVASVLLLTALGGTLYDKYIAIGNLIP
jgi:pilus assembly protein Flp/PilA